MTTVPDLACPLQLFWFRSDAEFRTRSKERDADTDNEAIMSIATATEAALFKAENERTGLKARIDDVLSRAQLSAETT